MAKFVFIGGKHFDKGKPLEVGTTVELTEDQAKSFADKFVSEKVYKARLAAVADDSEESSDTEKPAEPTAEEKAKAEAAAKAAAEAAKNTPPAGNAAPATPNKTGK